MSIGFRFDNKRCHRFARPHREIPWALPNDRYRQKIRQGATALVRQAGPGKSARPTFGLAKDAAERDAGPSDTQPAGLLAGKLYVQARRARQADGELRGQLIPLKAGDRPKRSGN